MIETWWARFLDEHRRAHPSAMLPEPGSATGVPLYKIWLKEFLREGITEYEWANAASERLVIRPAKSKSWHLATLIDYAKHFKKARPGSRAEHDTSTPEGAKAASAGCCRCDGRGLAYVKHQKQPPPHPQPPRCVAYCVCAYGRWLKGQHGMQGTCRDIQGRVPDLADAIAGRGPWTPDVVPEPEPCEVNNG